MPLIGPVAVVFVVIVFIVLVLFLVVLVVLVLVVIVLVVIFLVTKTQQVINKFSSKGVQDHATYLIFMVWFWFESMRLSTVRSLSVPFLICTSGISQPSRLG